MNLNMNMTVNMDMNMNMTVNMNMDDIMNDFILQISVLHGTPMSRADLRVTYLKHI